MSTDITILHNPRCSTSRAALQAVEESGRSFEVIPYLKEPRTDEQLRELIGILDTDPTELVRRDATFVKLGLFDEDVTTADQVVATLVAHPELLQRPIVIRHDADGDRAIIGRPKTAVPEFLAGTTTTEVE
ncbi:ArsC/Spx/MgsR family protein [Tessaracoccus caeni]|uniref:ArsC/Spx/MgsR family protein n=1 Tax=Tessaracoccus caeni TaxID=3031239 RepID=UPI0023DBFF65|nr:ArsC/Spx/MgsR family protein [Tessaracoccus caeni]MDF1489663.1 arsenate reductase [Tessaracoccus caeni]